MPEPVGEMKRLVSLVDRGIADQYLFPTDAEKTVFQPIFKPYHNFTQETIELPYTGAATWGQRITFTLPFPWLGDCLNWVAIRFSPTSWLPGDVIQGLQQPVPQRWAYTDISGTWTWASGLGSSAIALVEMEVNGLVIEQWSGDWIDVWQRLYLDPSRSAAWKDSMVGALDSRDVPAAAGVFFDSTNEQINAGVFNNNSTILPTEDGSVYSWFPFWFARRRLAAFPLASIQGDSVRFHITFRPFSDVVRRVVLARGCDETVLGTQITLTNNDISIPEPYVLSVPLVPPNFKDAVLVCGFTQLDGTLRKAYIQEPHECLIEPVVQISFAEPLKYLTASQDADTITVSLPLDAINGPVREVIWFLRRKAVSRFNARTNYGAYLENEIDPLYRPQRPLMTKAVLRVGSVVWADQEELWWRARGSLAHPGGIQVYGSYVYAYNFADKPEAFGPCGSMNASRAEMRLDLTVSQPTGVDDKEWEVQVFVLTHNWMRFQNGLAEVLFRD
jgi:Major capsid protein N-terminus/Large eukaryotic DNA virus major capsid protein